MTKVLTVGVFDLLHYGHFELFRKARLAGGEDAYLIVAVQEDEVVAQYKLGTKLVYNFARRCQMVRELRSVDEVIPYRAVDDLVKRVDFDVFAVGGDQSHKGFQAAIEYCREHGKQVVAIPRTPGISTTELK